MIRRVLNYTNHTIYKGNYLHILNSEIIDPIPKNLLKSNVIVKYISYILHQRKGYRHNRKDMGRNEGKINADRNCITYKI